MPKNAICGPEQALEFKKDQIELKIPSKGINNGNWRVLPLTTPVVMFCVARSIIAQSESASALSYLWLRYSETCIKQTRMGQKKVVFE